MGATAVGFYGGTAALYTLAAVAHLLFLYRPEWEALARWSTRAAWLLHTLALMVLVAGTGRVPVYTPFEAGLAVAWLLVMNYILYEMTLDNQAAGAFLVPTVALLVVGVLALPKPGGAEATVAALPASLVIWHVIITLLGYAFFVAAAVMAGMYLLLERQLRRKDFSPLYRRLPPLEVLDTWGHRFVAVGFPLLTVGLVAGTVFAEVIWHTLWPADPKVLWTLLTWLFYGAYLARRRVVGLSGRRAAWWAIAGLGAIVVNYFVVNWVSSLHRFGV